MTEVMVHTLVDGSFSFSGSKFNPIDMTDKAEMSSVDKLSENYKEQIDNTEKIAESNMCDSDTEDSVMNNSLLSESMSSSHNYEINRKNVSSEDYKILATKTTVTTYNFLSKSTTREIMNMTTGMEKSSWSSFPTVKTEAVDKSRVIVQVLKSDLKSKSQNIVGTKCLTAENQKTQNFRDDLCQLLSKSHSPQFDNEESFPEFPVSDTLNVSNTFQDFSSDSQEAKSSIIKARRKRSLNPLFWNGKGMKISDLKCVSDNLRQANPPSLIYLHYIMFNSFGLCGTALQVMKTRKNINNFSGFPFKKKSEQFQKKITCLQKIPEQLLMGMHHAVFGKTELSSRSTLIDQLLDFLFMPRKCSEILGKCESKEKTLSEEEYAVLKEQAIKGPVLSIQLLKLTMEDIEKHNSESKNENHEMTKDQPPDKDDCIIDKSTKDENTKDESTKEENTKYEHTKDDSTKDDKTKDENTKSENTKGENIKMDTGSYTIPAFILSGPGSKLKCFPRIVSNVEKVHEKSIEMLHYLLYGRIETSIEDCRRNILEFNGFSNCQQEFVAERKAILQGLTQRELFELCQILCIRAKTSSQDMRIFKIMKYLQSPSKPVLNKKPANRITALMSLPMSSKRGRFKRFMTRRPFKSYKNKNNSRAFKPFESNYTVPGTCYKSNSPMYRSFESNFPISNSHMTYPSSYFSDGISNEGTKLRDFRTICSNIECAAPSDLTELNDLLFMKTCDECDIHQKILDFTRFQFPVNSFHYDSRKTLMHYMGICVMRKIARLLDIENWDKITNAEDLSTNILKFLMEDRRGYFPSPKFAFSKSMAENNCPVKSSSPLSSSSSTIVESSCAVNPEISESFQSEIFQQADQAITHHSSKVVIQKLTKASHQTQEIMQSSNNELVPVNTQDMLNAESSYTSSLEDNALCLRDLIHHPSEQELRDLIYRIVNENLWDFTLGDLVQKVYDCHPKVNLTYQENFIKAVARQTVSELRVYALSAVNDQAF